MQREASLVLLLPILLFPIKSLHAGGVMIAVLLGLTHSALGWEALWLS